jgi:predicted DNA-binding transcriptional regulator YafY
MLIEQPCRYTRNELAKMYGRNPDTIKRDFEDIRNAGFELKHDSQYRYFLAPENVTGKVADLLLLTNDEMQKTAQLLRAGLPNNLADAIINKMDNLNSTPRLGNVIYNRPYLQKVQLITQAIENGKVLRLCDYKSTNSNHHKDRLVEPFHLATENDMLHAFDLERKAIRHFRLSRMTRIEVTENEAMHQTRYHVVATDIFNIADDQQEPIHIKLHLGGYNELLERYPLSRAYLYPSVGEDNVYELVCKVNYRFLGLSNFLLGYYDFVKEVVASERLRQCLRDQAIKMKFF